MIPAAPDTQAPPPIMHETSAGPRAIAAETATVEPPPRPESPPPAPQSAPESAPEPALPLDYQNPWPQWAAPSPLATAVFRLGVRRVVFAGGIGLLCWALVSLLGGVNRHVAPFAAGWGAAFVVLMLPLRPRPQPYTAPQDARRKPARRARRRPARRA